MLQRATSSLLLFVLLCFVFACAVSVDNLIEQAQKHLRAKEVDEARKILVRAIKQDDKSANAHYLLGVVDEYLGDKVSALSEYKRVFKLAPTFLDVWKQAGYMLMNTGQVYDALEVMEQGLKHHANSAILHDVYGRALSQLQRDDEAEQAYRRAIAVEPQYHISWNNLGSLLMSHSNFIPAIDALQHAMELKFEPSTFSNFMICVNRICNWTERASQLKQMRNIVEEDIVKFRNSFSPFHSLEFELHPKLLQQYARVPAGKARTAAERYTVQHDAQNPPALNNGKLRVGYFSTIAFASDATTTRFLWHSFGMHDRRRVEILCFGLAASDNLPPRMDTLKQCDQYIHLDRMNNEEAAKAVASHNLHILIDLSGFTQMLRREVIASRPAPIQMHYHGFPGTLGSSDYLQYVATDKITVTPETAQYYDEKQIVLPYTYLINDFRQSRREVMQTNNLVTRTSIGLPASGPVFCSFNQYYKIDPALFSTWTNIMRKVPKSVLWMMNFTPAGIDVLRKEAKRRGIDPSRLIFSDFFAKEVEFMAKQHCNLFLDSRIFNGHTTTSDALWVGIPVLTFPGVHWASRVALSLQEAAGISLYATTLQEYEAKAMRAIGSEQNKALKEKLRQGRETAPLWDTRANTQYFETGFCMSWDLYAAKVKPHHIVVSKQARVAVPASPEPAQQTPPPKAASKTKPKAKPSVKDEL